MTEPEVKEITGACYKRFRTRSQAEAFIEDWEESFADV
jgi:viroplasmin and RNaseH domain-containing protein